ncbi:TlpA family protein disulfide reductase [Paenibacillus protaetiae]|uniref:TlpA family protein disulfide reductase n=1 Tax=Paenibacillus protaetiae TaxID=2509456 RepID=A0A4P6EUP7_9BACL|nr:TlpA disulfide reductase family protein [Paenibacillus protaetiae]QAY66396.1 TlpA family protein disulfide reductase [Paenibacillus protaetiae]
MNRASGWFTAAFILAALAVYLFVWGDQTQVQAADFKPKAGSSSVAFQLPGLDDQPYTVGGPQDKLTLVNFWASWCGPCELEAPDLQKLHEQYGDALLMYGLNATKYDKERAARQFVQDQKFTFPVLMDRDGKVTDMYKVNTFPTTFLIDRNGVILERINGVITYGEWERLINQYIGENKSG